MVTGLGLVTPLGTGVPLVWQRLLDAHSGAQTITNPQIVRHNLPAKIAAYVPKCSPESSPASATLSLQTRPDGLFDIGAWVPAKTVPVTSQFVHFAMSAASQALVDAGWTDLTPAQQARTGVAVGSGIGGLEAISDTTLALEQRGYRRVSPYFIPRVLGRRDAHVWRGCILNTAGCSEPCSRQHQHPALPAGAKPRSSHCMCHWSSLHWGRCQNDRPR